MATTLTTRIILRNDTTANWEAVDPVLLKGEAGIEFAESGAVKMKLGDGTTVWSELPYFAGEGSGSGDGTLLIGDGKSIVVEGDTISIVGAAAAQEGQVPRMSDEGTIVWYTPITQENIDEITEEIEDLKTRMNDAESILENVYTKDETYSKEEIDEKLSSIYTYKGTVETYEDLPTEGMEVGDAYYVAEANEEAGVEAGDTVVWNGEDWDVLGQVVVDETDDVKNVEINGTILDKVDGVVDIPIADEDRLGVVMPSDDINGVQVAEDGSMSVASLSVDKLVNGDSTLILDGGDAETL